MGGALVLGLFLAEAGVRGLDVAPPPLPTVSGRVLQDDPDLIFRNLPGGKLTVSYGEAASRDVVMRVNGQGFRGPETPEAKPAGVVRVACLGDSHTFGYGVPEDETWPAHLSRLFVERDRPELEVLNFGVNAYDTVQEALFLESDVLRFEPDVVILQFFINDVSLRDVRLAPDRIMNWTSPRRGGVIGRLRSTSQAFDLVCESIWRRRGLRVYAEQRADDYSADGPGWRAVKVALRRMRDALAERDVPFVVALYPYLVKRGDVFASHDAFRIVQAFCEREEIPCYDGEPQLLASGEADLRVAINDYHANGHAHRIFAEGVAEWLFGRGWLGERARALAEGR